MRAICPLPVVASRTLLPPAFEMESSETAPAPSVSVLQLASEPDSKSSERYVPATMPVPESATDCEPTARDALRAPAAPGVKVALTVQLAPAVRVAAHVVVCAKSDAFEPEMPTAP